MQGWANYKLWTTQSQWRCMLLVGHPQLEMCRSTISATRLAPVVDYAYRYPYLTCAEDFYPTLHRDG